MVREIRPHADGLEPHSMVKSPAGGPVAAAAQGFLLIGWLGIMALCRRRR
jgi:hypothetical protein